MVSPESVYKYLVHGIYVGCDFLRSQKPPIFDDEYFELFQVSNEEEEESYGGKLT